MEGGGEGIPLRRGCFEWNKLVLKPYEYLVGTAFQIVRTACTKALRQNLSLICLKISKEAEMAGEH